MLSSGQDAGEGRTDGIRAASNQLANQPVGQPAFVRASVVVAADAEDWLGSRFFTMPVKINTSARLAKLIGPRQK